MATGSVDPTYTGLAYSGAPPGEVPVTNAFSFAFSQPFQNENAFTPAAHRVPKIKPDQPIFIDDKTGMCFITFWFFFLFSFFFFL